MQHPLNITFFPHEKFASLSSSDCQIFSWSKILNVQHPLDDTILRLQNSTHSTSFERRSFSSSIFSSSSSHARCMQNPCRSHAKRIRQIYSATSIYIFKCSKKKDLRSQDVPFRYHPVFFSCPVKVFCCDVHCTGFFVEHLLFVDLLKKF